MTRVLHVIHSVDPRSGGVAEGVRQLSTALSQHGVTVDVLSLDDPESPWVPDFPLSLFALGPGSAGYGFTPRALPWLIQHGATYDLIIVNGLWQYGGRAVWLASRKTKLRYAVFPHGMLDPWFKRRYPHKHFKKWLYWLGAEHRILRDAVTLLFTSEGERRLARNTFWPYRVREHVLGYGIASAPGSADAQKTLFLETHPDLIDRRLVLFLGRMHEKKGCDLLLRAFARIVSAHGNNTPHLVMAGPEDNAYGEHLRLLAAELGIEDHVTWTGMLTGDLKWGAYRAADVFILPSHQENFGVSVVEALACGRPVLISNQVNIWREIQASRAGFVEPDDEDGTHRLLHRWLSLSDVEKDTLCQKAHQCFEDHFKIETISKRFISFLSEQTPPATP